MPKRRQHEEAAWWQDNGRGAPICPLCDREIAAGDGDDHHLIPVQKGGQRGPKVHIHRFCHTKIHSVFTNYELAKTYNEVDRIREHPAIRDFIEWVAGKPSGFRTKNRLSTDRKAKQRR